MPEFEWDPSKESLNASKHHLDFTTASQIWNGQVIEKTDRRHEYGETRIIATGEVDGAILIVVYTWREDARRIISARKENSREQRLYKEETERRRRAATD